MPEPEVVRSPLRNGSLGTTGSNFLLHENQDAAGEFPRGGVPLHTHRTEDEAWYVLEGTLPFQGGTREFDAPAGSAVLLPLGTPHTIWNPGPGAARYLLTVGPKTEGLLRSLHGPVRPEPNAMRRLYASFDGDLLE